MSETPAPPATHRDRSVRLSLLGAVVLLSGIAACLFGVLHLALPLLRRLHPTPESLPIDPRAMAMGFLLYTVVGGVLIGAGVGSIRRRRWVPPIMVVVAWTWLIAGALTLLMIWGMLDDLMVLASAEAGELPPEILLGLKAVLLLLVFLFGVLLPAVLVVGYRGDDVARTCEAADPGPAWDDGCPRPVLGLAAGLALAAVLSPPLALRPAVPMFGVLATGAGGVAAVFLVAIVAGWLAVAVYRRELRGFWGTAVFLIGIGISASATFARVPTVEIYRALGYPEAQLQRLGDAGIQWWTLWGSITVTVLSVVYLARIRKFFP